MTTRRSAKASGPSQRQLRVGELLRHALADMLTRGAVHDAALTAMAVTIPEVRMSPDLRQATVYVMPLGGGNVAPTLAALERNAKFIRRELAGIVNLKFAPELRFVGDTSLEAAERVDRLLASEKVRRDLGT
jgi:ribosome-binding factor A